MPQDLIAVTDLQLRTARLAHDHWQRPHKEQPLVCSLEIRTGVQQEAQGDNLLQDSLNYGTVTKAVEQHIASLASSSPDEIPLEELAEQLCKVVLFKASAPTVRLELRRPRALLTAEAVGVVLSRSRSDYTAPSSASSGETKPSPLDYTLRLDAPSLADDTLFVRALRRLIIIGLNPCERLDEQEIIVDLEFAADSMNTRLANGARAGWADWRKTVKQVEQHLSASGPLTIEHIVTSLSSLILAPPAVPLTSTTPPTPGWDVTRTTVRVAKPAALMFARHPSVQVTRTRADFPALSLLPGVRALSTSASVPASHAHVAYLGLGTNLGARAGNLNDAVSKLEELSEGKVKVVDTSFMYESEAMYHEEQDKFLNAAVKVETSLSPLELLHACKAVEEALGRDFSTFRNGPRTIDLDVLLYDEVVLDTREDASQEGKSDRWLKVPHQGIQEREFVLRPLADIAPALVHPTLRQTPLALLRNVLSTSRSTVHRVFPLSRSVVHPFSRPSAPSPTSRTLLMSILNATPDSFSDGGDAATLPLALAAAEAHLAAGADVLDIGGMSTRPNAADVPPAEEAARVAPLVAALREKGVTAPLSVDTFRAIVAAAALDAGADVVNDVYGGRGEGMLALLAERACPAVLMHSRGDPATMTRLTEYSGGVVAGVRHEMERMLSDALAAGVRRWNVILDPGIGFAKAAAQNFAVLRALPRLFGGEGDGADSPLREYPVLVGLSRKRFLAPGKDRAKDRIAETGAATAACVASGVCEVVRVHDTREMRDVLRVADAIYRPQAGEE
ncbi:trifunctional dihydropteroate synthetase [Rhodotorula kratochvilovae]